MLRRFRIILFAFLAALAAFAVALPMLQAERCADTGTRFDRATLTCDPHPSVTPAEVPGST